MGKQRVLELAILNREEQTLRRLEVDGNKTLRTVVNEYLQQVDQNLLNTQPLNGEPFHILAETPNGNIQVNPNITVDDLIRKLGTDRIKIIPNAVFG